MTQATRRQFLGSAAAAGLVGACDPAARLGPAATAQPAVGIEPLLAGMAEGAGHYGIFNGRKWREKIAPVVEKWIASNG